MYKIEQLKSGLKVLLAPMAGANTVTFLMAVGTGSKYEDKEVNGISHFLEHMFFKGTKKYPTTLALSSAMDALGVENNAFTSKEMTAYYVKVDKKKAEAAASILSEMLVNSKFVPEEFERERGVIIEEINMYEDNPMMYVEDVFDLCLYGDTPAGRDVAGPKETIRNLPHAKLVEYFKNQYQLHNSCLIVAGDVSKVKNSLEKTFGSFSTKHKAKDFMDKEPVRFSQNGPRVKIKFKQTDQAHLSIGVPTVESGHPQEIATKLLSVILGGSMSSRLFIELRERRGLAYYIHTQSENSSDTGYVTTQAGVPVDKIEQAIETILQEYKKIAATLIKESELQRVKDMINGKLALRLESSDEIANWYSRQVVTSMTQAREGGKERKIYTPEEYLKAINKVTVKELKEVAKEYFKADMLNLAIIGPYKDEQKFRQLLKF